MRVHGDHHIEHAKDNYKSNRKKLRGDVKRLRYCNKHKKVEPSSSRCFQDVVRHRAPGNGSYKPWVNTVLDEKPITITSKAHHRAECARRNLVCPE